MIELKSAHSPSAIAAQLEFCRRYPEFQPLVLCSRARAAEGVPEVRVMCWGDFLLGGCPPDTR
ncbi:MAG TPA: hypothetical protein DCM05_14370 [Elusimicrobia bacterium]|nr:hypothetical protein [Elusimicrobiota bacterium]